MIHIIKQKYEQIWKSVENIKTKIKWEHNFICKLDSELSENQGYNRNTINYSTSMVNNNNTLMDQVTDISPWTLRAETSFSSGISDKGQHLQYQKDLQYQVS